MDKRRALQIMANMAEIYRDNLEEQKALFLYGLPSDAKTVADRRKNFVIHTKLRSSFP